MVEAKKRGHPSRVPYKLVVNLFPKEWDELRMEAQSRGIRGADLIGAILSQWIRAMEPPEPADPGDDSPEDA